MFDNIIQIAIDSKRKMFLTYDGRKYFVDPYRYGANKYGGHVLRCLSYVDVNTNDTRGCWKIFNVEKIEDIEIGDRSFSVISSLAESDENRMSVIFFKVLA